MLRNCGGIPMLIFVCLHGARINYFITAKKEENNADL